MRRLSAMFVFVCISLVAAAQQTYCINDFGASTDTLAVNTEAINKAIDLCHRNGGGCVVIPAGRFRTGTVILKDNVELHFENGACLEASDNYEDFPLFPPADYRSQKDAGGWSALIFAQGAVNISITGNGVIDGRGGNKKGRTEGLGGDRNGRPRNILFISCRRVNVSDIAMLNSAIWNQHYLDCEDVTVERINVFNHSNGNNDGIDIDGCRRFILTNSIIDSDDDGIVLKSTGPAPCEEVIISHCIVSSNANAIKCGTESTGGFKNILISDCIVKPSRSEERQSLKSEAIPSGITAISLEIVDGGVMDGVTVDNILIEGTACPLYVRLADRGRKHIDSAPTPPKGIMKNIRISNLTAYGTGNFCSSITGVEGQKIENITLNNLRFVNKGGLNRQNGISETFYGERHDRARNNKTDGYLASYRDVIEDAKGYPQPTVWGNLPSYGLFVKNVGELSLHDAVFKSESSDSRTPIIAVGVDYLNLVRIETNRENDVDVLLHDVARPVIDNGLKFIKEE